MSESFATSVRPVPRWLHVWAVLTAMMTLVLLVLGQLVTTFRAGMADPIWPTEPWYVFSTADAADQERYKIDFGFFIEHTHRIAGFTIGAMVGLLSLGIWWTEPRLVARWLGLIGLIVLVAAFGDFHRRMMAQRDAVHVTVPSSAVGTMAIAFGLVGLIAVTGMAARVRGSGLRLLGVVVLVAVMVQGLLGGLRVKLNELVGTDLAAVHGVFAQVVFSLLVSVGVLTALQRVWLPAVEPTRKWLNRIAMLLIFTVFLQLIWGAMVRHAPTPLMQRLHFLTAFAVVAVAVWLLRTAFLVPNGRAALGAGAWLLGFFLVLQVALGVEAWMGKFGTGTLPEFEVITTKDVPKAAIRTLHTLIGTGILATAVALAVRTVVRAAALNPAGTRVPGADAWPPREPRPLLTGGPQLGETS